MPSTETLERFIARVEQNAHVEALEEFYKQFGFMRLLTAMAIFQDQQAAVSRGHLGDV